MKKASSMIKRVAFADESDEVLRFLLHTDLT